VRRDEKKRSRYASSSTGEVVFHALVHVEAGWPVLHISFLSTFPFPFYSSTFPAGIQYQHPSQSIVISSSSPKHDSAPMYVPPRLIQDEKPTRYEYGTRNTSCATTQ